jgi:hypothetical protein
MLKWLKFQMLLIYTTEGCNVCGVLSILKSFPFEGSFHFREQESWLAEGHMTKVGS